MLSSAALISVHTQDDRLHLAGRGAWTAQTAGELEQAVDAVLAADAKPGAVSIDLAGVERMDTFGALLFATFAALGQPEFAQGRAVVALEGVQPG